MLERLEPAELDSVALMYEQTARRIRFKSAEKRERQRIHAEAIKGLAEWSSKREKIARILIVKMQDGMSPEAAIRTLSREIGEDEKKLAYMLKSHFREKRNGERDHRRICVIRLAQDGWSNQRIAQELGIHPNTVGRDLRLALNRNS